MDFYMHGQVQHVMVMFPFAVRVSNAIFFEDLRFDFLFAHRYDLPEICQVPFLTLMLIKKSV